MKLEKSLIENYTTILEEELIPAMGCTEPIAIAFAAAKAGQVLKEEPVHMNVLCSGNIIKNVKGVTVPNSNGQRGIEAAAVLGLVAGDADADLEVLSGVTPEGQKKAKKLVSEGFCDVDLKEGVPNLYIKATAKGKNHTASVTISDNHTNIVSMVLDGKELLEKKETEEDKAADTKPAGDRTKMNLAGILAYAETVDLAGVRDILEKQIELNSAISQEGIDNRWGAAVGKTLLQNWGNDTRTLACARAAAGADARMSGCPLPVVINSGSGNQGITVSMPVVVYARSWNVSEDKLLRALLVSNLVSIYIKHYIGALSAFCGAVSASCGAGAAITWMSGGDYAAVSRTITNTLGNVGGIVCDGAKPSCAAKIASSVNAALMAHYMSISERAFQAGEGIVEEDIEETIRNMGYIGKVGMKQTDVEILNVMIDRVDVDDACK